MRILHSLIISLPLKHWYLLFWFSFILFYQGLHTSFFSYMNFKVICYLFFNSMAHLLNYSENEPIELLKNIWLFQNKMSFSQFPDYITPDFYKNNFFLYILMKPICLWIIILSFSLTSVHIRYGSWSINWLRKLKIQAGGEIIMSNKSLHHFTS